MKRLPAFLFVLVLLFPSSLWAQEGKGLVEEVMDTSRSSWIEYAAFSAEPDSETGFLTLQIKGEKITYLDVPRSVWEEFKKADSAGRYYGERIKQQYERQAGEPLFKRHDTEPAPPGSAVVQCGFNEECEPLILRAIQSAEKTIVVAAYAFTRARIAGALVGARKRGVEVRMKVDARQNEYALAAKELQYLEDNGISVTRIAMPDENTLMHNKFMIFDARYVITGSYNYTTAAQVANWENVVRLDSPGIAAEYQRAWDAISSWVPPTGKK